MRYSIEKNERYTVLKLDEEKLDTLIAPKIKAEFITVFQSGCPNLILDLSKVKYADSSGLSAILVAQRLSKESNGLLVLIGITEHVSKLITLTKLTTVLTLLKTKEEAIDAIFLHELGKDLNTNKK